ncbi:MAG: serine/threonine protein kinase [Leptolyngbyaceae cyanobacterium SL_1_1]|nr:serine/threonine protein kinase [Leptolyngbyaceae cyanobacterium SL_1_1]
MLSLKHPNIAACHALVHTKTGRQLVLDYCEGGTLRTLVDSARQQMSQVEALQLMLDVLLGLEQAHQQDIIHCDIKPENILLRITPGGWQALISDFGIARLNQESATEWSNTGSPAYMAPERFYNQYSKASDLYSVGIVLYELLAGYRPFTGTPLELMKAHLNQPLSIPANLSSALQAILAKALQKLPVRRFRTAADMQEAILSAIADGSQQYWLDDLSPQPFSPQAINTTAKLLQRSTALACLSEATGSATDLKTENWLLSGGPLGFQYGLLALDTKTSFAAEIVSLPEKVCSIEPIASGLGIVTERHVYWVDRQQLSDNPIEPLAIANFTQPCYAAFVQNGWLAAATAASGSGSGSLLIQQVPQALAAPPAGTEAWAQQKDTPKRELSHAIENIITLIPLDVHHFALIADSAVRASTYFHIFTRKGTCLGQIRLRSCLTQVIQTVMPYRVIAFEQSEQSEPPAFLIIDLKPFRVFRKRVAIAPVLATATSWGYIIVDQQGQILFWDRNIELIGTVQGPSQPTALLSLSPHEMGLASWDGTQAWLQRIDLRQLGLALLF